MLGSELGHRLIADQGFQGDFGLELGGKATSFSHVSIPSVKRLDPPNVTVRIPGSTSGYVTDVCVPVSRLADCILRAKRDLSGSELIAPVFGHVGDGNFHVVYLVDPHRPEELEEARRLGDRLVSHALELGGTCSGEHGIGLGKLDALEREFGEGVGLMRDIKRALDPDNIMNPGKVVRL